jgi:flagellar hook-associated protein 2
MINLNITPGSTSTGDGIDVTSIVNQILNSERGPETLLQSQQALITSESATLNKLSVALSTLADKVNSLKDVSGALSGMLATSSQAGVLTATAQSSATAASHVIVVSNLATTASVYSAALSNAATVFATGTLNLQVGSTPVNISVDSQINTIAGLSDYINSHSLGITASVVQDANGSRLALVSKSSGLPGDITISGNTTGLSLSRIAAQNASLTIDGVPISSATNTVTGALTGITLNLLSAAPESQVRLEVTPDTAAAKQGINDFVTAYNSIISNINAQFAVDSSGKAASPLAANGSLRSLQSSLLADATYSITGNNGLTSLASIGVDMNDDGTFTVNSSKLDTILAAQFGNVQNLFQSLTTAGLAHHFSSDLSALTDSTRGVIALNLTQNANTLRMLSEQINAFEDRLAIREKQLIQQYSRVDVLLRQYPLLLSQVTQQLGVLSQK